nr:MAG TPA: hypothetical protein [Caudoviricetes sp.]
MLCVKHISCALTNNIVLIQERRKTMKRVCVNLEDEVYKQLRHLAVNEERTMTDIVAELVKAKLENKKEQSR